MKPPLHLILGFMSAVAATMVGAQNGTSARRDPAQIFRFLDRDGDGQISQNEFAALKDRLPANRQSPETMDARFKQLDRDGNESLSQEEFLQMTGRNRESNPEPQPAPAPQAPTSIKNEPDMREPMSDVSATEDPKGIEFFEKRIRPVLVKHCYECHSSESGKSKGGLVVDSRDGLLKGGDGGPAIVPGEPASSLLIQAIRYEDKNIAMPPPKHGGKLADVIIHDFEQWVAMGAPDPRKSGGNGNVSQDDGRAWEDSKKWWAWQPPQRAEVPAVKNVSWPKTDIDRFILAALESKGILPVRDADKLTLLRRVTFDLTGLPPTPQEIVSFLHDDSENAFEKVVDRLLDSSRFGEYWGRHWLDIARYAESTGKDVNLVYPYAWRYRDYVIESFNKDKPFDVFLREQIAGDLLPANNDAQRAEQLTATGFLALGAKSVNEANPRQFALDLADEQIDTVTQAFLGITMACARCHDHKFDPFTQKEYYAMAGIFLSTDTRYGTFFAAQNRNSSKLIELPKGVVKSNPGWQKLSREELQQKRSELDRLKREADSLAAATFGDHSRGMGGRQPRNQQLLLLLRMNQIGLLEAELQSYDENGEPLPLVMGVLDQPVKRSPQNTNRRETPRYASSTPEQAIASRYLERDGRFSRPPEFQTIGDSSLYIRGEVNQPGGKVSRGFPAMLTHEPPQAIPADSSGRLELAGWMLAESNLLTARVMVNRVWQWLFGQGLVGTPDNFGSTGSKPSNQALLDTLAVQFREDGWSVKKLIRNIVLSRIYQISTDYHEDNFRVDPDNELLWRMNKRRLDAESIRDAILSASGQLDLTPPVGSPIAEKGNGPVGVFQQFPGAGIPEELLVNAGEISKARSVYLPIARGMIPDALAVFDFAEPSFVTGKRDVTNVPEQALYMLNSSMMANAAEKLARRILKNYPSSSAIKQRVSYAYMLTLSRPPNEVEEKYVLDFINRTCREQDELSAWISLSRVLLASAEFRYLD